MKRKAPWGPSGVQNQAMARAGEHWLRSWALREQASDGKDCAVIDVVKGNMKHTSSQTDKIYLNWSKPNSK